MWKMQLLDEHHLFIKYTSEDVVTLRVTDPSQVPTTLYKHTHTHIVCFSSDILTFCPVFLPFLSQPSFFVVYNMVSTEVLAVFENTSDQLLELFENFCDLFRNATLHSQAVQFPCSASSNNYARQVQRRCGPVICCPSDWMKFRGSRFRLDLDVKGRLRWWNRMEDKV